MVFETMLRALPFRSVVLALRDPKTDCMTGRFGLGERAKEIAAAIRVPARPPAHQPADLFTAVCVKGADTLISDARAPGIAARLPAWHREKVQSPTFLVLPLFTKGATFGFDVVSVGAVYDASVGRRDYQSGAIAFSAGCTQDDCFVFLAHPAS